MIRKDFQFINILCLIKHQKYLKKQKKLSINMSKVILILIFYKKLKYIFYMFCIHFIYGLIARKIKVWEFFNKIEIFIAF